MPSMSRSKGGYKSVWALLCIVVIIALIITYVFVHLGRNSTPPEDMCEVSCDQIETGDIIFFDKSSSFEYRVLRSCSGAFAPHSGVACVSTNGSVFVLDLGKQGVTLLPLDDMMSIYDKVYIRRLQELQGSLVSLPITSRLFTKVARELSLEGYSYDVGSDILHTLLGPYHIDVRTYIRGLSALVGYTPNNHCYCSGFVCKVLQRLGVLRGGRNRPICLSPKHLLFHGLPVLGNRRYGDVARLVR